MLNHLTISNIAVIKDLDLTFNTGLTVLSGETGAGKSILLDALGLAIGARADIELIRDNCEKAIIIAEFKLNNPSDELIEILSEQGINDFNNISLRRLLQQDGRSRAWINDVPVSLGVLKSIGPKIIDIVGQYAQMDILDDSEPQEILDSYSNNKNLLLATKSSHKAYENCVKQLQNLKNSQLDNNNEKERLQSIISDLELIDLKNGELLEIEKTRKLMIQGQKISLIANELTSSISLVSESYKSLNQGLRQLSKQDENISSEGLKAVTAINKSMEEFIDAEALTESWIESLDFSPQELVRIEDRYFSIKAACRKYKCEGGELFQLLDDSKRQLEELNYSYDSLKGMEEKLELLKAIFAEDVLILHKSRIKNADEITKKVHKELPPLKLEKVRFQMDVILQAEELWKINGGDAVKFLFAANPGSTLKNIAKVASGGELSRFLLALKLALSNKNNYRSQVFDEIDMAVGGSTASAIGKRLLQLSKSRQVLVITHSPQVAAFGDKHFKIQKHIVNGKTNTSVIDISSNNYRQEEIARMLAGHNVTDEARKAAQSLLASS